MLWWQPGLVLQDFRRLDTAILHTRVGFYYSTSATGNNDECFRLDTPSTYTLQIYCVCALPACGGIVQMLQNDTRLIFCFSVITPCTFCRFCSMLRACTKLAWHEHSGARLYTSFLLITYFLCLISSVVHIAQNYRSGVLSWCVHTALKFLQHVQMQVTES